MYAMYRRINITLPEKTLKLIDHVSAKGDRSRFIDEAVREYVKKRSRAALRKNLKEGAIRDAEQDLAIAEERFPLEEEAWQKIDDH
jgi:CopG family transcriptional regulator / antitoxin EndoAI